MATQYVQVQRRFEFAPLVVWDRYVDHERWREWAGTPGSKLVREGAPDRNGVGAVRQFAGFVREEVTEFDPPHRLVYRVTRGMPFRGHEGEVTFEPGLTAEGRAGEPGLTAEGRAGEPGLTAGPRTLVTWRCSFEPIVPGTGSLLQRQITRTFRRALAGLDAALATPQV